MALSNSQHPFQAKQESSLWTPDGNVPLHTKGVDQATAKDMQILADLHEVAQKFGLVLVCRKCDHSFRGENQGNGRQSAIFCKCRQIRHVSERLLA